MPHLIDLLVFDARLDLNPTLDCPEIRATPQTLVDRVCDHIFRGPFNHVIIRTYNDQVVNLMGELVERRDLHHNKVQVWVPDHPYPFEFDREGVLRGNLPIHELPDPQSLLQVLQHLHHLMQDPSNWYNAGICYHIPPRREAQAEDLMARWPRGTGDRLYPVPGPGHRDAYLETSAAGKWDRKESEYARNRWDLLEWMIKELEA